MKAFTFILSSLTLFALSLSAQAAPSFTLVDNVTGQSFTCGEGTGGGDPINPISCIREVTELCRKYTGRYYNDCYSEAKQDCGGAARHYPECVKDSTEACRQYTGRYYNDCYHESRKTCKGSANALRTMLESTRQHAEQRMLAE